MTAEPHHDCPNCDPNPAVSTETVRGGRRLNTPTSAARSDHPVPDPAARTVRPILFLDVDGPLNPYAAKPSRCPADYETHRMRPAGWDDLRRKPLRVWLNPTHGAQLLALPYDLVWATTWAHEANEWIAPHIGLPELPVVEWPDGAQRYATADDPTFWKTRHLVAYAAGRPFAWVDDDLGVADKDHVAQHHPGPALLHWVSPRDGLLDRDFAALRAWAATLNGGV